MERLNAIFYPDSVAVIGASTTPGKVGHDIFANILKGGYRGTLFPVNPRAKSVLSVKAYSSILAIEDPVDMSMVILPPILAVEAVKESIAKGVKGIVIVSAGFREVGEEGAIIEKTIVDLCKEAGVRLVGPNCLGVINPHPSVSLNASFSSRMPHHGPVAFISQSGALCTAVLDFAADRNFGFSKFISIGNKADVDELDLLTYLHEDKDTEVILIYLEELRRGQDFVAKVREITSGDRPTPVLVIKSGRTAAGAQAAASHTGSLGGSEAIYEAFFQQSGMLRVDSIEELFNFATAFVGKKIPRSNKVAIITNAGGPGIVATDVTVSSGLELAQFLPETVEALKSHLPATANVHNPVDVIGDAPKERYENALKAVIKDENVDGALVILTPQSMTNALGTAEAIAKIYAKTSKPILSCFMGVVDVSAGVSYLREKHIPVFTFPEHAAQAFGALYAYSRWINRQHLAQFNDLSIDSDKVSQLIENYLKQGKTYLGELETSEILKAYGFNTLPGSIAVSAEEATAIADVIGYPIVMKVISPDIIHKTDAGGVLLGLNSPEEVQNGYGLIESNIIRHNPKASIQGILVQKMAPPDGVELILGATRYPLFGPLVMVGLGGIFVEVFKDVAFRLAPVGRNEARRMIRSIKGYPILSGLRGKPSIDFEHLERLVVSLSLLVVNHPEIKEMDINPLLVFRGHNKTSTVADCRIILEKP